MSVLAYPRIHFQGQIRMNPATANNDDVMVNVDPAQAALAPALAAMTDAQARQWLMEGVQDTNPVNGQIDWYLKSGWNLYGDMSVQFQDAVVSGVVGLDGTSPASDPLVGKALQITGRAGTQPSLCDVDPRGGVCTQLFLNGLQLGDTTLGLTAVADTRCYSRWITFRTCGTYTGEQAFVGFGATWQFAIPSGSVAFTGAASSTVLQALQSQIKARPGILVQFATYQMQPTLTDVQLIANFQAGQYTANPVVGYMVGTIGLWEAGELATAPGGRRLQAPTADSASLPWNFGPAAARVQPDRPVVSLNLITTFPEADYNRPTSSKMNLGQVALGVIPPGQTTPVILGPVAYDYASYWALGGIADVPYNPSAVSASALASGSLVLVSSAYTAGPILSESGCDLVAETDDRGMYVNWNESTTIHIQVLEDEGPPKSDVTLTFFEYQNVLQIGGTGQRTYSVITLVNPATNPGLKPCLSFPATATFPAGRTNPLPVDVKGILPGPAILVFTQNGQPLNPSAFNPWSTASFTNVRVMPDDSFDQVLITDRLGWDFIYQTIFRFYNLLFPAMSQYIPLDDEAAMKASAQALVDRTDPAKWHTTLYMPVTRDLSAGKRKLLVEWAQSSAQGSSGSP